MGHEIVYCSNCSSQLRGQEFESGKAFRVEDQIFCAACCKQVLGGLPAKPMTASSTAIMIEKHGTSSRSSSSSSTKLRTLPHAPVHAPQQSATPLILGVGLAVAVLGIAAIFLSSGSSPAPTPPPPPPAAARDRTPIAPSPPSRESSAQSALARALKYSGERPDDLDGQVKLFDEAEAKAQGTSLAEDAKREALRIRKKAEEKRLAKSKAGEPAFQPPVAPAPTPDPEPAPTPAPPPPTPAPSPAVEPWRASWEAALAATAAREYPTAIAALEKISSTVPESSRDLELLRQVSSLQQEAVQALAKLARGQKVVFDVRDVAAGRRIEGTFLKEEGGRISVKVETGVEEAEVGEIFPSSLLELLRTKGSAPNPVPSAIFCLLEGETEAARKLLGDRPAAIPDRLWAYAKKAADAAAASDSARSLYVEARKDLASPATAADGVAKLQALLRDHAADVFVRRNKPSLAAQAQSAGRDFLFLSEELRTAGTLRAAKGGKAETYWTSEGDLDPAKAKDNYVEAVFSTLAETPYKCWVLAGGCCQETFEFSCQGSELLGGAPKGPKEPAEPGSTIVMSIKPWFSSLKKTHSMHSGPKQAAHWEWVAVPLPKYAKAGTQRLRILFEEKGFGLATLCVSATRAGPPTEAEIKEALRSKGERPKIVVVQPPKVIPLITLALDGTDRRLVGRLEGKSLFGETMYNSSWCGLERNEAFTIPPRGELRVTYFIKIPTIIRFRLRLIRGNATVPYDVVVNQPVVGTPTEIRIPFSDFRSAFDANQPPAAPGDQTHMIYIFTDAIDSGLRVDAFSLVEIRAESAAKATPTPGKVLFSENFDGGPGKFAEGEWVDGGVKGSKAYSVPCKGVSAWNAYSIPAKDNVIISFKLKPLGQAPQAMVLVWSDKLQDNGRFLVDGLKQGEWNEVRFKATQLRIGPTGEGPSIDHLANFKIFLLGSAPEVKVLLDDFEIRE